MWSCETWRLFEVDTEMIAPLISPWNSNDGDDDNDDDQDDDVIICKNFIDVISCCESLAWWHVEFASFSSHQHL